MVHPDTPTRALVSDVLSVLPAVCEECDNGADALNVLERRRFDLVIVGDWLPAMRGTVIADACLRGGDPTPVVMLETDGPFGIVEAGGPRRPARVACPFSPADLVEVCRLRLRSAALL